MRFMVYAVMMSASAYAVEMTQLVEMESFLAPGNTVQMRYSAQQGLLFLRNGGSLLRIIDTSTHLQRSMSIASGVFADMDFTPDGQYLYATDYGGSETWYSPPSSPNYVRRYDLAADSWETRLAPAIAYNVAAISADQFALLSYNGILTMNAWGSSITQTYSSPTSSSAYNGNIDYHADTQRVLGSHKQYPGVSAMKVMAGGTLESQDFGTYPLGDTAILSSDGRNFYFGKQQVDALNCANGRLIFAESIYAGSADLAFGKNGYYDAATGTKLGTLGFATTVFSLDVAGTELWAFDPATDLLHHYAIIPEPTGGIVFVVAGGCWLLRAGNRQRA